MHNPESSDQRAEQTRWNLFVDGASRNNPGQAGAGVYLYNEKTAVIKQGFYLGIKTSNQAEYWALILGLYYAERHIQGPHLLVINADSQLMIKQLERVYRVRNPELIALFGCVTDRLKSFTYALRHIPREQNGVADKLANLGIDKKLPVPLDLHELCFVEQQGCI